MAYLFADGFDWPSVAADLTMRWDTMGNTSLISAANTAFGVGGAVSVATTGLLAKSWSTNDATIFGTVRRKHTSASGSGAYLALMLQDGGNAQVTIRWNDDGSLAVYSGSNVGTLLGSSAGAFTQNVWDSWQFKAVIHNTAGSMEIRKNGSTAPILNLTNVNTRGGSANAYANKVQFVCNSTHYFDDFLVCSSTGAAPNDWLGDLRCCPSLPNATAQGQWSGLPVSTTWGVPASSQPNFTSTANFIYYGKTTAVLSGTTTQASLNLNAAYTGTMNVALYADDGPNGPGTLLAQGTAKVNPGAGVQTYTLGSSVPVVRGRNYWAAIWWNTNTTSTTFFGLANLTPLAVQSLTYGATFPASAASGVSSANQHFPSVLFDLTSIQNHSLTADPSGQDSDTSYVYSSTAGQEDLYSFPTLASQNIAPLSIAGVIPFAIIKKSDAGARTVSVRCKSGSTDVAAITDAAVPNSYTLRSGFLGTDPNTSAAWTIAGVNAATVGVKCDA